MLHALQGLARVRGMLLSGSSQIDTNSLGTLLSKVQLSATWGILFCSVGAAILVVILLGRKKTAQLEQPATEQVDVKIKI